MQGRWRAEARQDYRASETMMVGVDLDWEYLSLEFLLDELVFLDLVDTLGGVVALFRHPGVARFLGFCRRFFGLGLGGAYKGHLGLFGIACLAAGDGVPNRDAWTTGAALALTGALGAGFSCLA